MPLTRLTSFNGNIAFIKHNKDGTYTSTIAGHRHTADTEFKASAGAYVSFIRSIGGQ